jgi:heme/copper-type cytochrome/quinol oxidase subunit 4
MWSKHNKMKKKIIIFILSFISALVAISLFFASRLSELSDLELFDIEEDDF